MTDNERGPVREALADALTQFRALPWRRLGQAAAILIVLGVVGAAVTVALAIRHYSEDLPDVGQLEQNYRPPQVTRVLARDGTLLANVFSERRTVVPFTRVPDHVKSAFLAAEDAGFYEHEGLDYLGLVRAMVTNLRAGRVRQGGSTITQQVVKNVLLDQERSYRRKVRETILAYQMEKHLTKEQILGMYMNHIYLGHGRYGVEEAARFYFGKHVEELNVGEAALIAGIVASPERYSPRKSEEKALIRRKYVLGQMLSKGFMTQTVHDGYVDAALRLAPETETESDVAPEMLGHARRLLAQAFPDDASQGGFSVTTTIDPALQVAARQALRTGLDDYLARHKLAPPYTLKKRNLWGKPFVGVPKRHRIYVGTVVGLDDAKGTLKVQVGSVIGEVNLSREERFNPKHQRPSQFVSEGAILRVRVLDEPTSGSDEDPIRMRLELGPQAALVALSVRSREVLAAVGSYEAEAGGLDRTVQSKRQPGSTFKPVFYSYALAHGQVTPATVFELDLSQKERQAARLAQEKAQKEREALGEPSVEEEPLPLTEMLSLRQGVLKSDNRVALQVFQGAGAEQIVSWAEALGIVSKLGADESLALGSYEVTPLEMAGAYSVFASGGIFETPKYFLSLERGSGPLPLPASPPPRKIMDPAAAYLMTDVLTSVIKEGTGRRASSLGIPLAGKTGTTNQAKDAWFVGYSTEYVVAVWVGYDDAHPLGWGESGASAALPIWMSFMKEAHKGHPATEFARPNGITVREVDPKTGLLAGYGQQDAVSEIFLEGSEPKETASAPDDADDADDSLEADKGPDADEEPGPEITAPNGSEPDEPPPGHAPAPPGLIDAPGPEAPPPF